MPSCRNCGARLSKFDSDICPVCGTKKPLEGVSTETIDITSQVDMSDFTAGQKVVRRRKSLLLYFLLIGFTGAPFFYLKQKRNAFLWLIGNLVVIGGLFAFFFFALNLHIALAIILPVVTVYVLNAGTALIYNYIPNLKDGEGEFVV